MAKLISLCSLWYKLSCDQIIYFLPKMKMHQIKFTSLYKRMDKVQRKVNRQNTLLRWHLKDVVFHTHLIVHPREEDGQALVLNPFPNKGKGREEDISKREEGLPLHRQVPHIPLDLRIHPCPHNPLLKCAPHGCAREIIVLGKRLES